MKLPYALPRVLLFALALWSLSVPCRTAAAQDDPAVEMARDRFKEGVRYYDQKQYEKARAAFLQAYALKQHPSVLLNLAQSELRSGHEAAAATHFAQYLREATERDSAEYADAEKGLAAAKEQVGEIIVTVDAGADLLVDGENRGKSPLPGPLYLAPGSHKVEAKKGALTASATVEAAAGKSQPLALKLGAGAQPAATAPPATSRPAADADEEPEAEAAAAESSLAAEIDTGAGHESFFAWIGHTPLAWVGAGLTVIGIGGGVGFGLAAKYKYDGANDLADTIRSRARSGQPVARDPAAPCSNPNQNYQEPCSVYLDRVDTADTYKTLSLVSWIVAGAAATGTVVYYFVDRGPADSTGTRRTKRRPTWAVAPVTAPSLVGATVTGTF